MIVRKIKMIQDGKVLVFLPCKLDQRAEAKPIPHHRLVKPSKPSERVHAVGLDDEAVLLLRGIRWVKHKTQNTKQITQNTNAKRAQHKTH